MGGGGVRNAYTRPLGSNEPPRGTVKQSPGPKCNSCILDGECLVWNTRTQKFKARSFLYARKTFAKKYHKLFPDSFYTFF